jgi:hypothetical protein
MLMTSGKSLANTQSRASTRSDSKTAPARLKTDRTMTSALGATLRTTPAMNVP